MQRIQNFIDGEFTNSASGEFLECSDPSTGRPYLLVPDSDQCDVAGAVAAADAAFEKWSKTPAPQRSRVLLRLADLLESQLERFALAECVDTGKPLTLARSVDIPRAVANFRFFGSSMLHVQSESHATDDAAINYTLRKPRGVVGAITPWNLPLYLLSWKIAPAMAMGNSVVAKPSELTPMTAFLLGELCGEAGLPPGVLNIVQGTGPQVGAAIVRHPRVSTISFTGGTVTGAEIASTAAGMFKRVSLELGGKNPNIIFADADMKAAVAEGLRSSFANQGQVCLCGSRILVEKPAFESFLEQFVNAAKLLNVGDPLEPSTDQGAVVSRTQFDKVLGYLQLARDEGGTIHCGGGAAKTVNERCKGGFFVEPTVITDLDHTCRVNQEEIFGPVVTIAAFRDEEEAVALANATDYGLSASVWTRNIGRAHRMADRIQAGTIWVNCWLLRDLRVPFGGMKRSGVGREGGQEALRFFTEPKNVCIKIPAVL